MNPYSTSTFTQATTVTNNARVGVWFTNYSRALGYAAVERAQDDLIASLRKLEDYLHEISHAHH